MILSIIYTKTKQYGCWQRILIIRFKTFSCLFIIFLKYPFQKILKVKIISFKRKESFNNMIFLSLFIHDFYISSSLYYMLYNYFNQWHISKSSNNSYFPFFHSVNYSAHFSKCLIQILFRISQLEMLYFYPEFINL